MPEVPDWLRAEYPFASHELRIGGHAYHYIDEGPRVPRAVVFVHGNPTWSFYFRKLIRGLSGAHRVIAPDHLGCGLSDKPQDYDYTLGNHIANLEACLESSGLEKIVLAVHDWGGPIGLGYAARHPEKIAGLVVFNTAAFLGGRLPWRLRLCRVPVFGDVLIRGGNAFAALATRLATAQPGGLPDAVARGMTWPYGSWADRIATLRFVQDIPVSPGDASYPVLQAIEQALPRFAGVPIRMLWGDRDWVFTPAFRERFQRIWPRALTTHFSDAGHYVIEDKPGEILDALRQFVPPLV